MAKRGFLLIGIAGIFLLAVNCTPSRVAMDYGTSYKLAKFNQTLDPEAEKNLEPVTGFDGRAAEATIERYHRGFRETPRAPVYSIYMPGFGTGMGAGMGVGTATTTGR